MLTSIYNHLKEKYRTSCCWAQRLTQHAQNNTAERGMSMAYNAATMDSVLPKYHMVKLDLENRIHTQEFKIGDMLPSESMLMKRYGVSRITVRWKILCRRGRSIASRAKEPLSRTRRNQKRENTETA